MTKSRSGAGGPAPALNNTETSAAPPAMVVGGKLGLIVELLKRPQGADLSDMMEATGWQQHSVRGALAGALKKQRGLAIISEKGEGPRIYRIAEPPAMMATAPAKRRQQRTVTMAKPAVGESEQREACGD